MALTAAVSPLYGLREGVAIQCAGDLATDLVHLDVKVLALLTRSENTEVALTVARQ